MLFAIQHVASKGLVYKEKTGEIWNQHKIYKYQVAIYCVF